MELSLHEVAQIVLGIKHVKIVNTKSKSHVEDTLTLCLKASLNHISIVYSC